MLNKVHGFSVLTWAMMTKEQRTIALNMVDENLNDNLTGAEIRADMDEKGRPNTFFAVESFCLVHNEKPISFVFAEVYKDKKELEINFAVSPLNSAKKRFVKLFGTTPIELLVGQAVDFGIKHGCKTIELGEPLTPASKNVLKRKGLEVKSVWATADRKKILRKTRNLLLLRAKKMFAPKRFRRNKR